MGDDRVEKIPRSRPAEVDLLLGGDKPAEASEGRQVALIASGSCRGGDKPAEDFNGPLSAYTRPRVMVAGWEWQAGHLSRALLGNRARTEFQGGKILLVRVGLSSYGI